MNRSILYGVVGGVAVLAVAGYFYVASKGVEEFEDFLYENELDDMVRYDEVDYSPVSDTIEMQDVELELVLMDLGRGGKQQVTGRLDSLSIEGASDDNERRITFTGFVLSTDPSKSDRKENMLYGFLAEPLQVVRRMGIEEIRLDGSVAYGYDKSEKTLDLGVGLSEAKLGSYEISLSLARAHKLLDMDMDNIVVRSMTNPAAQLEKLGRIEFVSFDANVEDYGLIENLVYVDSLSSFNYANALNNGTAMAASTATVSRDKLKREMGEFLDDDSLDALSSFQTEGGNLSVSIRTKRPVPLAKLVKDDKPHRDISFEFDH